MTAQAVGKKKLIEVALPLTGGWRDLVVKEHFRGRK
jgi:hypothetical protein